MLDSVKDFWDDICFWVRDFKLGIKNLIVWFPIIWKDRDWDDHYIFEIIKFKLSNQSDYISKRNFHTNAKRDAQIMKTCVRLIEKIQTEHYNTEYLDYIESEIKFVPSKIRPGSYEMNEKVIWEDFSSFINKYPNVHRRILKMKNTKFPVRNPETIAMNICDYNHNRARKILFSLLERNIERWWD